MAVLWKLLTISRLVSRASQLVGNEHMWSLVAVAVAEPMFSPSAIWQQHMSSHVLSMTQSKELRRFGFRARRKLTLFSIDVSNKTGSPFVQVLALLVRCPKLLRLCVGREITWTDMSIPVDQLDPPWCRGAVQTRRHR